MTAKAKTRCAIYARTSTEEGLSQEFNSLDAQIEACRAYIASQIGEGWVVCKETYVDGGFSGGSMERPALQALIAALADHEIDVVVVYKVDRLTRALADFAKIVERLDKAGASFVSVTQSFNTTTSMGRLTLNVLLSFAQFEREVTAERIRDKIAASKAKGMWMGGVPPLGYDVKDRHLVINTAEAERVRFIFSRYLELSSITKLAEELPQRGLLSKSWTSQSGVLHEGGPIMRGALEAILANPIYRGLIRHHGKTYPGRHEAIIDDALWQAVQARRAEIKARAETAPQRIDRSLLLGRIKDDSGAPMRVSHTRKAKRRYQYYVSASVLDGHGASGSLPRVSAGVVDRLVVNAVGPLLSEHWRKGEAAHHRAISAIKSVEVGAKKLRFELEADAVNELAVREPGTVVTVSKGTMVLDYPVTLAKPKNATTIIGASKTARVDRTLVRAIALARHWADQLESGIVDSVVDLAASQNRCIHYTNKLLPLAYLAPDLVEAILEGRQPQTLTLSALLSKPLPLGWDAQRAHIRGLA